MKKPYTIGIAGGSASGKSTFCEMLQKRLANGNVKVIHMDEYFKQESDRPYSKAPVSGKYYVDDNHPLTMDLPQLKLDMAAVTADILIVEGLLTLWDDEILAMLDLRLFVECRADERIVRRLRRNMEWGLTFDQISSVYLDMVRFRHDEYVEPSKWRADFIINGSQLPEKAADIIAAHISIAAN